MFDLLERNRVEELHMRCDAATGLRAIIAIHNTRFGPALGGCRFQHYPSTEAACQDAVRLAKGMSYKAVLAGVEQGGGKSVIIKPPGEIDRESSFRESLFRTFGRFVDSLGGRYITAIDAGTSAVEMDFIHAETTHVTSTSEEDNPSVYTAKGVFEGIRAAVKHKLNTPSLQGITVAVQGIGNVGYILCQSLHKAGAKLVVSDIDPAKLDRAKQEFGATVVDPDAIYARPCEVFAPCGLGAIINDQTLPQLQCEIIAGSANNQLATAGHGLQLHQRNILYAPDYVINAGGLVYASLHHKGKPQSLIEEKTQRIAGTLTEIFTQARERQQATSNIAEHLAEQRLYHKFSAAA